jgi:ribosome biogenesis protein MAK21
MADLNFLQAMKASIPKIPDDDALSEESNELPSDFDMSEEGEDDESEEEEAFELAEASDNDDLLSLDADGPEGLIEYDGTDSEWGGIETEEAGEKRKRRDEWKERRKKLRSLPTFASYDEYAKMIEDGPEDDI